MISDMALCFSAIFLHSPVFFAHCATFAAHLLLASLPLPYAL